MTERPVNRIVFSMRNPQKMGGAPRNLQQMGGAPRNLQQMGRAPRNLRQMDGAPRNLQQMGEAPRNQARGNVRSGPPLVKAAMLAGAGKTGGVVEEEGAIIPSGTRRTEVQGGVAGGGGVMGIVGMAGDEVSLETCV